MDFASHEAGHSDPHYTGRLLCLRGTKAYRDWEWMHKLELDRLIYDAKSYMRRGYEPRRLDPQ